MTLQEQIEQQKKCNDAIAVFDGVAKNTNGRDAFVQGRLPDIFTSPASTFIPGKADAERLVEYKATAPDGTSTAYYGPQLTTFDKDLLLAICESTKTHEIELPTQNTEEFGFQSCTFEASASQLLRLMGYSTQTKNVRKLKKRLICMQATCITVTLPDSKWIERNMSIIAEHNWDTKRQRVNIKLSMQYLRMFLFRDSYPTYLEMRAKLKSSVARELVSYLMRWKKFRDGEEKIFPLDQVYKSIHWKPLPPNQKREFETICEQFKKELGIDLEFYPDKRYSRNQWYLRAKRHLCIDVSAA